jgi:WD40 repeat protein
MRYPKLYDGHFQQGMSRWKQDEQQARRSERNKCPIKKSATLGLSPLLVCLLWFLTFSLTGCTSTRQIAAQVQTRLEMEDSIVAIALSQTGNDLAVLAEHNVYLYSVDEFRQVWSIPLSADPVTVALSPDGTLLALKLSGSSSTMFEIWDIATGERLQVWEDNDPMATLTGILFSPDGTRLATARDYDNVALWDTKTGQIVRKVWPKEPRTVFATQSPPSNIAWSHSGERIAFGLDGGKVVVWDMSADQAMYILEGHKQQAWDLAFSPDETRLASRIWGGRLIIWDLTTGEHLLTLEDEGGSGGGVAWSPDGMIVASGWGDGRITLWDVKTGRQLRKLEGQSGQGSEMLYGQASIDTGLPIKDDTRGLAWSPDGSTLFSGTSSGVIVWDVDVSE